MSAQRGGKPATVLVGFNDHHVAGAQGIGDLCCHQSHWPGAGYED